LQKKVVERRVVAKSERSTTKGGEKGSGCEGAPKANDLPETWGTITE